ncbi:hypothetical protein PsYK624_106100 [Phanerochaete sordida]|uniref:Uncharacterized protein n=1 Tax=Phanerochaete sordida TaxID=48140 RepID=A0A9P3GIW4_9APHY|nr:hypothetical protein PsYK624_106100 [Phanerochaete sordida]
MLAIPLVRAATTQALLLALTQFVSARSSSHNTYTSSSSPPRQCYDSNGHPIACKWSWIPIIVVVCILAVIFIPLAIWYCWRLQKRKRAANPKYEELEESEAPKTDATIDSFNSDAPYDPAPSTDAFPAGYSPPTVDYEYKSTSDDDSIKELPEAYYPLATFKPPPGSPPPVHAASMPSYDPPAYAPSAASPV